MPALRRSIPERVAARAVTGSLGHLVAGVADWVALFVELRRSRRRPGR